MTAPSRRSLLVGLGVALGLGAVAAVGQESEAPPEAEPRLVQDVRLVLKNAGRVAYSKQGDRVAFDKITTNGRYQLHLADPVTMVERCITCENYDLKKRNNLSPSWHPSGEYLVFTSQNAPKRLGLRIVDLATPNRGLHSEVLIIRADGKGFWQLTRTAETGGAVLDPHFSFEGDQLVWSLRVRSRVGRWGAWVLQLAEFNVRRGVPRLSKPRTIEPGGQKLFLAASTFTADDRGALVSANREPGQNENGMDVYRVDFETSELTRLTHTRRAWDEKAHYSPSGDQIAWVSAAELELPSAEETGGLPPEQIRDIWIMNVDGSNKTRLSHFNSTSSREAVGHAIVDNFSWNPRGDQILAHVLYSSQGQVEEALYRIDLRPGP